MTQAYSAGGSRHSAVFVAAIGLHVGLFFVLAGGLGPKIRDAIEAAGPMYLPVVKPKPEPRHVPGNPVLADPYFLPVPEPPLDLPEFQEPAAVPTGRPSIDAAGSGSISVIPATAEYVAASLRTRRERLHTLIDSCYPAVARRQNEEGRVVARVVIGAQGSALSWSVAGSSGFPHLDAAVDCVIRRLAFEPARRDGSAVGSEILLPIMFRLD